MKLFQINEDDLETMERALPELMDRMSLHPETITRKDVQDNWSMVKEIISRIRWNYGPPIEVKRIDAND